MKRVVRTAAVVVGTLTGLLLLWEIRLPLLLLLSSFALSASIDRIANRLARRLGSRGRALLAAYSLALLVVIVAGALIGAALLDDVRRVTQDLVQAYRRVIELWSEEGSLLSRLLPGGLPSSEELYQTLISAPSVTLAEALFGVTVGFLDLAAQVAIVLVLSIYWSLERREVQRSWLFWLSDLDKARLQKIWTGVARRAGMHIQGQAVQALGAAFLLWAGYRLLGLRYPMILAVVGAIARLVPWLGTLLAVLLPLLAGLRQGPLVGIAGLFFAVGLFSVLDRLLMPRFYRTQRHSALLVLALMVALAQALGLVGAILAPMLAVAVETLFAVLWEPRTTPARQPLTPSLLDLHERLDELIAKARRGDTDAKIAEAAQRFETLLDRASRLRADLQPPD